MTFATDEMPAAVAVFGTDTGVGKTIVTAAIAAAALLAGRSVRVLKPVQTGADTDDDGATVDRLVGRPTAQTGWRLKAPLAPAVAARLEGSDLDAAKVTSWCVERAVDRDLVIVETAGGAAVEIAPGFDMALLAAVIDLPAIVVCRPGLGTLNHSALTVAHLRSRGVEVLGLVISGFPKSPGLAERTNPAELERLAETQLVGVVPPLGDSVETSGWGDADPRAWLGPDVGGEFDRQAFLAALGQPSS